jgi:hypothetical protein
MVGLETIDLRRDRAADEGAREHGSLALYRRVHREADGAVGRRLEVDGDLQPEWPRWLVRSGGAAAGPRLPRGRSDLCFQGFEAELRRSVREVAPRDPLCP